MHACTALHCSRQSACRAKSLRVTLRKADFAKAELRARACERACEQEWYKIKVFSSCDIFNALGQVVTDFLQDPSIIQF